MKTPLVDVTWIDCYETHSRWMPIEEYLKEAEGTLIIHTVGYLLLKNKKKIILTPTKDNDGKVSGIWVIPRRAVLSIKRLTNGGTRKAPTHHR